MDSELLQQPTSCKNRNVNNNDKSEIEKHNLMKMENDNMKTSVKNGIDSITVSSRLPQNFGIDENTARTVQKSELDSLITSNDISANMDANVQLLLKSKNNTFLIGRGGNSNSNIEFKSTYRCIGLRPSYYPTSDETSDSESSDSSSDSDSSVPLFCSKLFMKKSNDQDVDE